ncbi:hypothetical protein EB093_06375 [bacterium]|nr:hypothetical protein [bacterium]
MLVSENIPQKKQTDYRLPRHRARRFKSPDHFVIDPLVAIIVVNAESTRNALSVPQPTEDTC